MTELAKLKREYAELVIKSGLNLQPGQRLSITCPVVNADFARLCAAAAYEAGCKEVLVRWRDDALTRMKYLRADDAVSIKFIPGRSITATFYRKKERRS